MSAPEPEAIALLRCVAERLNATARVGTHSDRCHEWHVVCAVNRFLDRHDSGESSLKGEPSCITES